LLGSLQSDALEARFGWLRQLSGANYYISMRQVIECDKKIRVLSLIKFSDISLNDIDEAISNESSTSSDSDLGAIADAIVASMQFNPEPSDSDRNIIFYVSGYIARSVVAATKCDYCREALISPKEMEPMELLNEADNNASMFLDNINRGGLVRPTDFVYLLALHCWRVFEEIWNTALKMQFLTSSSHRQLFGKIMDRATFTEKYMHLVFGQNICSEGHDLQELVVRRFFNCVAKNFVRQLTNTANDHLRHLPPSKKRKIAKLTGSTMVKIGDDMAK
jgi:hypothetical protein